MYLFSTIKNNAKGEYNPFKKQSYNIWRVGLRNREENKRNGSNTYIQMRRNHFLAKEMFKLSLRILIKQWDYEKRHKDTH